MPDSLDELRLTAIEYAKTTGALADIEKAASISKAVADEKKASFDIANAGRSLRLTRLQAILSAAIALVSVLGLIGTSIYNIAQLSYNQRQAETTEWRELLAAIDKAASAKENDISNDITIPFRLRSFMDSPRHANDVRAVATRFLGKMADAEGFRNLFTFVFPDPDKEGIETINNIARQLNSSFNRTITLCAKASDEKGYNFNDATFKNICYNGYTDKQAKDFGLSETDTEVWNLRRNYLALGDQMSFISQYIARYLTRNPPNSDKVFSLRDIRLSGVRLDNLNFRNIDITGAYFIGVSLKGATLTPSGYQSFYMTATNWWDAESVDPHLLQYLIENFYPKRWEVFRIVNQPSREEYTKKVYALCKRSRTDCSTEEIKFEEK